MFHGSVYLGWQILIAGIRSVTVVSYVYVALILVGVIAPSRHWALSVWMVAEAAYYLYNLRTVRRLQRARPAVHKCNTAQERQALLKGCIESMVLATDSTQRRAALESIFSRWFHGADFKAIQVRLAFKQRVC